MPSALPSRTRNAHGGRLGTLVVGLLAAITAGVHAAEPAGSRTFDPTVPQFAPVPIMPSCATVAPVRGDPRSGPSVVIVMLAPGCRVPWHWHTPNEDLVFASGTGVLDMKDGRPLRFHRGMHASLPSRHVHQMRCPRTCAFFSVSDATFDIHYVDDAGNEISMDDATKAPSPAKPRK
jgi:quercetin dioxygenase-like cupin family protein